MSIYEINRSRQVCWDMELADRVSGVTLQMHKPVRKGVVLECGEPWEGEHSGYGKILYDGEKYRFYYRGCGFNDGVWKTESGAHTVWCVAYSFDGKHFYKPDLGLYEYRGSTHNNILSVEGCTDMDNFSILLDTNPVCPPDERYKAIAGHTYDWRTADMTLKLYKSADGLSFRYAGELLRGRGRFDSLNNIFWESERGVYRIYLRDLHQADPAYHIEYDKEFHVRSICMTESADFVNWSDNRPLDYGENDKTEFQLYTNGVLHYYRSDIFVGLPMRYIDRAPDEKNYAHLPDLNGYRDFITKQESRSGTAITDTMIMTSRDGLHFERYGEAFFTPGPECGDNWVYGGGSFAHGLIETASDFPGEPNEISLYTGTGYRSRPLTFERYTIRLDGFFSWHAPFAGGEIVTRPLQLTGDAMSVNFATSAVGYLRIEVLNEQGEPIEGYDSGRLFGDSVDRPVEFDRPLAALAEQTVRLRISLRECDLYSFCLS